MAAGIMTISDTVIIKAGANINATLIGEYDSIFIPEAESLINVVCRYNFSANYGTLSSDVKLILEEVASNLAAIYAINYDVSGIITASSIREAENRVVVLRDAALRGLSILKDKKQQDFINGT